MNEVLYADSDTDHYKLTSNKVWILASQPIQLPTGSAKQKSLKSALQTAVRYKHEPLKSTRRTVRFIQFKPTRPKMVQAKVQASRVSSLSKALKKAVQIKNGRCIKKIGPKVVEGTTVWTLTPQSSLSVSQQEDEKPFINRKSSFITALTRFGKNKKTLLVNQSKQNASLTEEKLIPVGSHSFNVVQVMAPTA